MPVITALPRPGGWRFAMPDDRSPVRRLVRCRIPGVQSRAVTKRASRSEPSVEKIDRLDQVGLVLAMSRPWDRLTM